MATAEPTHADDADAGQGTGPRIPLRAGTREVVRDVVADTGAGAGASAGTGASTDTVADPGVSAGAAADPAGGAAGEPGETGGTESAGKAATAGAAALGLLRRYPVLLLTAFAGVLHIVWFFTFANSGGDLAAQDAWAEFVGGTRTRRTTSPGTAECTRSPTAWCRRT